MNVKALEKIAWAPYETLRDPAREDWKKAYDALKALAEKDPADGRYPNTLGYLCYYGRHTGERDYGEARRWFEKGAALGMIESAYKLADMLMNGLGGERDPDRACACIFFLYDLCRERFERGEEDGKFADVALRMGRIYHEGTAVEKDDLEALGCLLEARFALNRRKAYQEYGDGTVEKNILSLLEECEKPDEETRSAAGYGLGLGRVLSRFLNEDHAVSVSILERNGFLRLEFRRVPPKGKKAAKVLWSVAPAMKCFLTDFVVLYAQDVREVWLETPGEPVTFDSYSYEPGTDTYRFSRKDKPVCRLSGGEYVLSMNDFFMTGAREAANGSDGLPVQ